MEVKKRAKPAKKSDDLIRIIFPFSVSITGN
jgi:hypothetical protein